MNALFPPCMLNKRSFCQNSVGNCTCLWLWKCVYI